MWFARAGFPPGARAKKNALLAPNHAQRLGAFFYALFWGSGTYSSGRSRLSLLPVPVRYTAWEHLSASDEHHLHAVGDGVPRGVEHLEIWVFRPCLLGELEAAQIAFGQA